MQARLAGMEESAPVFAGKLEGPKSHTISWGWEADYDMIYCADGTQWSL
jgi:hypothetical protein